MRVAAYSAALLLTMGFIAMSCGDPEAAKRQAAAQEQRLAYEKEAQEQDHIKLLAARAENLSKGLMAIAIGDLDQAANALDLVKKADNIYPGLREALDSLELAKLGAEAGKAEAEAAKKERELLHAAEQLPASEARKLRKLYFALWRLRPENEEYERRYDRYMTRDHEMDQKEARVAERAAAEVEILDWSWGTRNGFAIAEGRIKNVSGRRLERVEAVFEVFTSSGDFITSNSSLIEFDPILPGQTSPFKVMTRGNPAMKKAELSFKLMFGGKLKSRKR